MFLNLYTWAIYCTVCPPNNDDDDDDNKYKC